MAVQSDFSHLDMTSFKGRYLHGDRTMSFFVEGVKCSRCLWKIEQGLKSKGLVETARVNMSDHVVEVKIPEAGSFAQVAEELVRLGFPPYPIQEPDSVLKKIKEQNRSMLLRLGVAGAASGNIMLLAIAVYAGVDGLLGKVFDWLSFFLFLPVVFFSAQTFFINSYRALRQRKASIDMPIVMALSVGGSLSAYHLFIGDGAVYFDSMSVLVFLLLCSRYLLYRWQQKYLSPSYLEPFLNVESAELYDLKTGLTRKVPLGDLLPGQVILVRQGEKIPVDGELLSSSAHVNSAVLTGESAPQRVLMGSPCYAATVLASPEALIKISKMGEETRLGKILSELKMQTLRKSPLISFTDRFAQNFTFGVIALGVAFFSFYAFIDLQEAIKRVLALSLVACPCALVFATPLAQSFSLMKAARKGYFIKRAEALEKLSQIKEVVFDKTGTLTEGQLRLRSSYPDNIPSDLKEIILGLEKGSDHPIAQALRREFSDHSSAPMEAVEEVIGVGVRGCLGSDFYELRSTKSSVAKNASPDLSWVSLSKNGEEILSLGLGDKIRQGAKEAISQLKHRGLKVSLLSGDQAGVVRVVGYSLGIPPEDLFWGKSPEDKLKILENKPRALMVGDGVNDAIAMAKAHVSLAVHGSMEASLKTSDIYLSNPGVLPLGELLKLSSETLRVIRRSLHFSIVYNVVAGTSALFGLINPLVAAVLMPIASFTVLTSSFVGTKWLRGFGKSKDGKVEEAEVGPQSLWPVAQENI